MKLSCVAAAIALSAGAACSAQSWTFGLDGLQEVPSNGATGTGTGTVTYNAGTNVLSWNIEWTGLSSSPTGMHFHVGNAGTNGPHGVHIMSFTLATNGSSVGAEPNMTPTFVAALLGGGVYVNIHTLAYPGGEIRGQVVPAPGAAACGVLGLGLLASRRRR